jgi:hypothetical protein
MDDLIDQGNIDKLDDDTNSFNVTDEEDVSLNDESSSGSHDIDKELEKVGLQGDEEGIKPLGENTEVNEE